MKKCIILLICFSYLGRISNRFSKDIGAIDDILPKILVSYFQVIIYKIKFIIIVY